LQSRDRPRGEEPAPADRQVRRVGERAGDGLELVVELGNRVGMTVSNVRRSSARHPPAAAQLREIIRNGQR